MEKFIVLTNEDGTKSLINLRHLLAVVEHEGNTYVSALSGEPSIVLETVGDIMSRLETNTRVSVV